jgi:hypothetical protein
MASYNPLAFIADTSLSINGKAFSWKDVDVKMLGSSVQYIQSIEWSETEEASYDVGAGQVGKFLGVGNREVSGSMEIALSEFMKLAQAATGVNILGSPLDIPPFPLNITYYSRLGDVSYTNIYNVKFTSNSHTASQGDTHLYASLDFIATNIEHK